MSAVTIRLTDAEAARAADLIAHGRFASLDDLVREAFRLLEERQQALEDQGPAWPEGDNGDGPDGSVLQAALPGRALTLEELRSEIRKGEESGEPIEIDDLDAFFDEIRAEAEARGAA